MILLLVGAALVLIIAAVALSNRSVALDPKGKHVLVTGMLRLPRVLLVIEHYVMSC